MEKVKNLHDYFEIPSKIKLKGGKEVYGVIWPILNKRNGTFEYFFSSAAVAERNSKAIKNSIEYCQKYLISINIQDIVQVEHIYKKAG